VISLVGIISEKIIKTDATKRHILKLKCTKIDFGWGSAPDPAAGAYSAPPAPLAGCKGPTSSGKEGRGRGRERRKAVRGGEVEEEGVDIAWPDLLA